MSMPVINSAYGKIHELMYYSYIPAVINTGIDIKLFEALSKKEMHLRQLAEELDSKENLTGTLLEIYEAVGLVEKRGDAYGLTPAAGDFLVESSGANQLGAIRRFTGSRGPFDNLTELVKKGAPGFNDRMWSTREAVTGMEQQNKAGTLQAVLSFVTGHKEFSSCRKMCDFAGSIGYYSLQFLRENPGLRAHVYDLPEVCSLARELKQDDRCFDRITYHDTDIAAGDSFGDGYDLFFSSHFLYEYNFKNELVSFLKRVNSSMNPGGLFVSNHVATEAGGSRNVILSLVELMARISGYPTHKLPEEDLKNALTEAGFGEFRTELNTEANCFSPAASVGGENKECMRKVMLINGRITFPIMTLLFVLPVYP